MNSYTKTKAGQYLVLYFQVHQPNRLNKINFFSIGSNPSYFNDSFNRDIITRIARTCYLPANRMLQHLIEKHPEVKVCFSISGTALDQFERFVPEVLASFRELADTGQVEFLSETNYHSLSSLITEEEFQTQVLQHAEKIQRHFDVQPSVFRNTELIYNDQIGKQIARLGYQGIICDGVDRVLNDKSTFRTYNHPEANLSLLLRANQLSDDIAFRYENGYTRLSVDRYMNWLNNIPEHDPVVLLGVDYETFGEHHKHERGILNFLQSLILRVVKEKKFRLSTPSEVIRYITPETSLSIPEHISWADEKKDVSAWLGNDMQQDAFGTIKGLETSVKRTDDPTLLETWRNFQTSDHFYYMSTKRLNDGDVHTYFNHYPSPYEAFINYMNAVSDFAIKVNKALQTSLTDSVRINEYERQHTEVPAWAEEERANHTQELFVSRP